MQEQFTEDGKRYFAVTEEEIKLLPQSTLIYHIADGVKGIAPTDCEHDFFIGKGMPSNIKGCRKCIYWEFTKEPATE